jgi:hypothetical protein
MKLRLFLAGVLVTAAAVQLGGCASEDPEENAGGESAESSYEDELINAEKNGQPSQKWIYDGMLPRLERPEVVGSLKGHTVRVTGLLPRTFQGELPFYAEAKPVGDRTKVTVVYPIATGKVDPSTGLAPAAAGTYTTLFGIAYTPTNTKAPWGGFPFMMYHSKRGIAFHGPITSVTDVGTGDLEWHLYRGPVSHGCNRMAGEHIVEMAHLVGIDMTKPYKVSDRFALVVKTTITPEYDVFDGNTVDVDYPAEKGVVLPTGTGVKMYPTWRSDDFPRFVCAYQADRPLGAGHCGNAGKNRRDPVTGKYYVEPSQDPWIGASCAEDGDCGFTANGKQGSCTLGTQGAGVCTIPCEGGCPDRAGSPVTFCATFPDGAGRCVSKAEAMNQLCQAVPGTAPKLVDRMIGASKAKAAKSTVCLPQ